MLSLSLSLSLCQTWVVGIVEIVLSILHRPQHCKLHADPDTTTDQSQRPDDVSGFPRHISILAQEMARSRLIEAALRRGLPGKSGVSNASKAPTSSVSFPLAMACGGAVAWSTVGASVGSGTEYGFAPLAPLCVVGAGSSWFAATVPRRFDLLTMYISSSSAACAAGNTVPVTLVGRLWQWRSFVWFLARAGGGVCFRGSFVGAFFLAAHSVAAFSSVVRQGIPEQFVPAALLLVPASFSMVMFLTPVVCSAVFVTVPLGMVAGAVNGVRLASCGVPVKALVHRTGLEAALLALRTPMCWVLRFSPVVTFMAFQSDRVQQLCGIEDLLRHAMPQAFQLSFAISASSTTRPPTLCVMRGTVQFKQIEWC